MSLGNGSFIIGQEQDRMGGGFSESESFVGNITLLDIWDTAFTDDYIMHLYRTCEKYYGTLFTWSHILEHIYGDIMVIISFSNNFIKLNIPTYIVKIYHDFFFLFRSLTANFVVVVLYQLYHLKVTLILQKIY